ncbi:tRNA modification GTPase [Vibrio parahaemolyticus]|jgi:ABC-type transporter Mla subunit MlaD|uniref:tRNA modification GTPase n=1 Tax=Proteus mirabilis TaxID=584 RepID=UPI00126FE62D|nr:tRNA modification GTPase [Salmonella enterica subsp. enterica serovar Eastbourne]EFE9452097.1 tRNA modification GTPase [Escherichia coli]MDF4667336.1 tRNA modification GTPase [Vibrio parahaemolyticus]MDF4696688.1 tRNA modification GTPase [Vibrio parahaemolyticus]MDG2637811.1 tRNA modification GTPase [Vibrio parahaemolyticus]
MNDEIKKIAALIGHQQMQEKRVAALIDEFQAESAKLSRQTAQLAQVIHELDSASGKMTDTVRQSVNAALTQVEKELKQTGLEQQKPAVNALNQVVTAANESVSAMRREMSRYTWKSAIYIVLTMLTVMGGCLWGMVYFIDSGYDRIAEMQRMEAVWEKKAPLANISTCEGKPCVQVSGDKYTNKNGDIFYQIKR